MATRTFRVPTSNLNTNNLMFVEDFLNQYNVPGVDDVLFDYAIWDNQGSGSIELFSELNHPGIVRFSQASGPGILNVFPSDNEPSPFSSAGGIAIDNNFNIQALFRLNYNVSANTHSLRFNLDNDGETCYVRFNAATGVSTVEYDIGGGLVVTAVPIPASGIWAKLSLIKIGSSLSIYLNTTLIVTGTWIPGSNAGATLAMQVFESGSGSMEADIDYVTYAFSVNR